jgi:phospholipid:diacylglycerol acyltransferase
MLKRRNIKRAPSSSGKIEKVLRYRSPSEQLPEDILASSSNIFHEYNRKKPIWKRKRFHFVIGLSVGLLAAAYGASTTPAAQTHFNDLQAYLADQLSEMDLASMFPTTTDIVDELLSNVTSFFTPAPSNDQSFMPALTVG